MKIRFIMFGLLATVSAITQAQVWDLKNDFDLGNNPSGAWNYGRYDSLGQFYTNTRWGLYSDFSIGWSASATDLPYVGINNSGGPSHGSQDGQVILVPDDINVATPYAGIHWVSPITDTIHVTGTFYAGDSGTVNEFTSINRISYFGVHADEANDWSFSYDVDVTAGDFLDFFIGPNSSGIASNATTPIDIHITSASSVPEPASFAILGVGAVALIRRKKRS